MSKQCVIFSLLIFSICYDESVAADSRCGDWEPFKEEKCFKIFDKPGLQSYEGAEKTCHQQENDSSLISIRFQEEQEFISDFLFKTHKIVDNIWIGAKYTSNKFKWSDDSDLVFTNWAEGSPKNKTNHCVQLNSDENLVGKWSDVLCDKKNLVVCQKMQTWSLSHMQKLLLNTIKNPFPIGFIYVQLPNQPDPQTLWATGKWENISPDYSGHFFRVEGGNAAPFGQSQSDAFQGHDHGASTIDTYGGWYTGGSADNSHSTLLRYSQGHDHNVKSNSVNGEPRNSSETRPINYSVRIWKRVS